MQPSIGREIFGVIIKVIAVIFTLIFIFAVIATWYTDYSISDGYCNVAVLPIEGEIAPFDSYDPLYYVTAPSMVRDFLAMAEEDPYVQAVLFDINSPGGTPVAAEQISELIVDLEMPTVSVIGDMGASAAYLIAASADKVIASPMSTVGSIGVTMSYVENSEQNESGGLNFVELASGKFKDAGNPNKVVTEEERELFLSDLTYIHDAFVAKIAELRHKSIEEIQVLADGSSMPGVRALEAGLVDRLGGRNVAKEELAIQLGLSTDEIVFCEYSTPLLAL